MIDGVVNVFAVFVVHVVGFVDNKIVNEVEEVIECN